MDFIIERTGKLIAIEVKSGETVRPEFTKSLTRWSELCEKPVQNLLLYSGDQRFEIQGTQAVPWRQLSQVLTPLFS